MSLADYRAIPERWRALVSELNGGRIPDGEPGIRDVDAPCEVFLPAGAPWVQAEGTGECDTDGHYICSECVHISRRALYERQERCEETGDKMASCTCLDCRSMRAPPRLPAITPTAAS